VNRHVRIFVGLAFAMALCAPIVSAQKPPAPPQPPNPAPSPGSSPGRPTNLDPSVSQPIQPSDNVVSYLRGRVMTDDGTPLPKDMLIERLCNTSVRQQVYASPGGDYSMQLGQLADSVVDASAEPDIRNAPLSQGPLTNKVSGTGMSPVMGIPERDLRGCELRASISGFRSSIVTLVDLHAFGGIVDVGDIVVQRTAKVKGAMVSAAAFNVPGGARKAFERGLDAEKHSKLAEARGYFENAVKMYPKYTNAWFRLGVVLQKQNQTDAARDAYTHATTIDSKFLPPYASLAFLAYKAENWSDVRDFTGHILDLDPLNYAKISGEILDLDQLNYSEIYFYNTLANFQLNNIEEAQRSGLKAERLALRTHHPQLHLLMAEIFARKKNYASAIAELHTYLDLVPPEQDVAPVRQRLAELEKLNASDSSAPH
jgi:tetratricopeptide (TPR) repeat protein